MKHVICYSGGKSSALVAGSVVKKFGKENVVLLNHQVDEEPKDVERFENEIAKHLGIEITYANAKGFKSLTPYDVAKKMGGFKFGLNVMCTYKLKTEPFQKWLEENDSSKENIYYYGFDKDEPQRISRRSSIMGANGYKTDYPLALWENPLDESWFEEIGIKPPMQYQAFKHANCMCCWKAGKQSWYVYFVNCRGLFDKHVELEEEIGHSILKDVYLDELIPVFEIWKKNGVPANENIPFGEFYKMVNEVEKKEKIGQCSFFKIEDTKPCDCVF